MEKIERLLKIELPAGQSAFLWGPRKTGKSTLLRGLFPESKFFDFLNTDLFFRFTNRPALLGEELDALPTEQLRKPIILDEVQKIPHILDEVHRLIENKGIQFVLCGSSARKLKRGQSNLLGGRAWRYELFPLVTAELRDWSLLDVLNKGMIPSHFQQPDAKRSLRAYVQDYIMEEVIQEGLVRNIPSFSRFFDSVGFSHGEMTNYLNISRDCGIDSKTVREYYQILIDTLMGIMIDPYKRRQNRMVITRTPKFYLFDTGVAGVITKRYISEERGELFGKAFEHFILMEIVAFRSYHSLDFQIGYWRTKTGLEVDFILGDGEIAIEVKGANRLDSKDLKGILTFTNELNPRKSIIVCNEPTERRVDKISIMPYRIFLAALWSKNIIA
ncbi:MAG: AAA family ATPase [Bacteroidetes bacterium]|nr:AAA family ATPase [Bacteroidota bacterium]